MKLENTNLHENTPVVEGVRKESSDSTANNDTKSKILSLDQARLKQTMLDLRWLIMEGYVTEYGNGKIFARPPMPEPKKVAAEPISTSKATPETAVKSEDNLFPNENI